MKSSCDINNRQLLYVLYLLGVWENYKYDYMASEKANNTKSFIYFFDNLMKCSDKVLVWNISKACFIIDNASINKTTDVKVFVRSRMIPLLTIFSYYLALNDADNCYSKN